MLPIFTLLITLSPAPAWADTCEVWGTAPPVIAISKSPSTESSGVARSMDRPGVLFTHDDRNGPASLFAFDVDGNHLGVHPVKGATNYDWEDLAAAPCPDVGNCIYIGDIGDNGERRSDIRVYIATEPAAGADAQVIRTLRAEYPDGPRDAEALLVHPCSGEILIITKDDNGPSVVYRFPQRSDAKRQVLEEVGPLNLTNDSGDTPKVTSADFTPQGDGAVLRTREQVWTLPIDPAAPLAGWSEPGTIVDGLSLTDSEAITFTEDGGLIATSEGTPLVLAQLQCEDLATSSHTCVFPQQPGCSCTHAPNSPVGGWLAAMFWLWGRRRPGRKRV